MIIDSLFVRFALTVSTAWATESLYDFNIAIIVSVIVIVVNVDGVAGTTRDR